jgi:hypothetical protein
MTRKLQRFDRFRSASGLEDKSGVTQVNSLIYSMGPEADDIFASFELNDENKKKYTKVKETFDNHFNRQVSVFNPDDYSVTDHFFTEIIVSKMFR